MTYQHEWKRGDWAYRKSDGSVAFVEAVGLSLHGAQRITVFDQLWIASSFAPVMRGRDLPPMPHGGRLARVFHMHNLHGQTVAIEPHDDWFRTGAFYALLEVYDAPTPEPSRDEQRAKLVEAYATARRAMSDEMGRWRAATNDDRDLVDAVRAFGETLDALEKFDAEGES